MEKIPEEQYKKALFQARTQIDACWSHTKCHGLQEDFPGALEETMKIVEQFAMRVRGKDIPIKVREIPRRKPTE